MPELGTYLATEKDGARGADQRGSTRKSPDNPDEHSVFRFHMECHSAIKERVKVVKKKKIITYVEGMPYSTCNGCRQSEGKAVRVGDLFNKLPEDEHKGCLFVKARRKELVLGMNTELDLVRQPRSRYTLADTATVTPPPPFDCSSCTHSYNTDNQRDNHLRDDDYWWNCDTSPCPNRLHNPLDWADDIYKDPRLFPAMSDNVPPPPPPAQSQNETLLQALLTSQKALTDSVALLTTQMSSKADQRSRSEKPAVFAGDGDSADACRFLAAFSVYGWNSKREMNVQDADGQYYRNDRVWISTALSFMVKDAALWATPYMEEYSLGRPIFDNNWATFEAAFKLRFESVDEKEDAKHRLKALHQDKMTVAEYTAKFKELMGRTGYSTEDYDAEKRLEAQARPQGPRPFWSNRQLPNPPRTSPFPAAAPAPTFPTRDPNAMDIDANRTRADWLRLMNGKCFSCGSTEHRQRDGGHEREICNWCRRNGHREAVCFNRWLGRPRGTSGQRVAATETPTTEQALPAPPAAAPTTPTPAQTAPSTGLDALIAQMEQLQMQIATI
ncbi:hypothetical protein VNI00_018011, partial [Paramarasmius palmivorus]